MSTRHKDEKVIIRSKNPSIVIGSTYGDLKVIALDEKTSGHNKYYRCTCNICGKTFIKCKADIIHGINLACSDCCKNKKRQEKINDMIGKQFGYLVVEKFDRIEPIYRKDGTQNGNDYYFICKCMKCGNLKSISKKNLTSGRTVSCGCYNKEVREKAITKHGLSGTPFMAAYNDMIQKCTNPNYATYRNFGAIGVRVEASWYFSNENFIKDMYDDYIALRDSAEYDDRIVLERYDTSKAFSKSNCYWAIGNTKKVCRSDNPEDIVGLKFGKLTVKSISRHAYGHYYYICDCDCGRGSEEKERFAIINVQNPQCKKCEKEEKQMQIALELVGKKFNKLTIEAIDHFDIRKGTNQTIPFYKCKCDCGNPEYVVVGKYDLTCGYVRSCGCLRKINSRSANITHGMSDTRFYNIWCNMKARCTNPNNPSYNDYGGRGITICPEWEKYENFEKDMYESYKLHVSINEGNTTIDRINNNDGYYKDNCRWATAKVQSNNTRTNAKYIINGQYYTIEDIIVIYNSSLSHSEVYERLRKNGYNNGDDITWNISSILS